MQRHRCEAEFAGVIFIRRVRAKKESEGWISMKRFAASIAFVVACSIKALATDSSAGYVPPHGFVPDAATATAIARAVLIPIYGADTIRQEEPLVATRQGEIWIVDGTLQCPKAHTCMGGTAKVKLSAKDGRILFVMHYK